MKTIDDLRDSLFDTLAALRDKQHPMDIDRARAISEVAGRIIDSAKVEVDFLKVTGASRSTGFLPAHEEDAPRRQPSLPPAPPTAHESAPKRTTQVNGRACEVAFSGRDSLIGDRESARR